VVLDGVGGKCPLNVAGGAAGKKVEKSRTPNLACPKKQCRLGVWFTYNQLTLKRKPDIKTKWKDVFGRKRESKSIAAKVQKLKTVIWNNGTGEMAENAYRDRATHTEGTNGQDIP